MPQILSCSLPTDGTSGCTSDIVASVSPYQYTLAIWGNTDVSVVVNLYGAFTDSFSPQWLISTTTACAGGTTGSGRHVAGTDYFPYKRVTATQSASTASACAFAVYLENRERP